jgi:anti-sigma-K factor RskA
VTADPSTTVGPRDDPSRDERWYLADEEDFLRRSLDDARREHEAGDLADEDYDVMVARDSSRLAEVVAELADLGPEPSEAEPSASASGSGAKDDAETPVAARRPMAMWRRVGVAASCLLIVAGIVLLVTHFVQARQPGQASSGSISVSQAQQIEQQLQQADSLANAGGAKNEQAALVLFNDVLAQDPSNPAALASAGWLMWNLGTSSHVAGYIEDGRAEVTRSVSVSPTYYQGHLYLGLILANQDHNNAGAVVQFDEFLADDPPTSELPVVAPEVDPSYVAVGKPAPAGLVVPSSTSTTAPSAP